MPAAHAPRRWPSCPACGGRKLSRLPGWAPREAPGGCFFSSVALSTAPCQGSSGPFRLAKQPACCSCTSKAPLVPWLSWALLPIASLEREPALLLPCLHFPRGSCLCKRARAWKGSRLAAPSGAATVQLSLHAIEAQGRHESAFHASLAKKHSGAASFGRQKGCLSSIPVMLWKIPHGTTPPCFFFGVRSFLILILPVLTLQETGSAWPVFLLLLSVAL